MRQPTEQPKSGEGTPSSPLFQVRGVSHAYGNTWVLQGVDLDIWAGTCVGLLGPNGAGKTTLLRLLLGLMAPTRGEILLEGRPVQAWGYRERARRLSVVFSETLPAFPMTVEEVVALGRAPYLGGLGFLGPRDREAVDRALRDLEVEAFRNRWMETLSAGERQRVWIARALAQEAPVLFLDEPTSHLDLGHQVEMLRYLRRLHRDGGRTLVVVTHDLALAAALCEHLVLLQGGRVVAQGAPEAVLTPERIQAVYGCRVRVDHHPETGALQVTFLE